MKIVDVIILASDFSEASVMADRSAGAGLDRAIVETLTLGRRPIVVIGPEGDALLRECPSLERAEMVFDPNFSGDWFSSVKAGLLAAAGPAHVAHWSKLAQALPRLAELDRLALARHDEMTVDLGDLNPEIALGHGAGESGDRAGAPGFSFFTVTLSGAKRLKTLPADSDWQALTRAA